MKAQRIVAATLISLVATSCGADGMENDINRPIAQSQIKNNMKWGDISPIIQRFSQRNNFAVQQQVSQPQGMVDFNARLFRDDITIMVGKLRDGPVEVTAYPLCVCEMNRRYRIQAAADAAVTELTNEISAQ